MKERKDEEEGRKNEEKMEGTQGERNGGMRDGMRKGKQTRKIILYRT